MASVLVTGATSGIGEALIRMLVKNNHHVIACGRNQKKLDELSNLGNIDIKAFDISDKQAVTNALSNVSADIYVLNAGICEYVDVNDIDASMFERVFATNVFGISNIMSVITKNLVKGNKVVFVDSLARLLPFTRSQAYGASKAAVHYMAKSFAVDLAQYGVKVKTISPGFVKTPLTDKNDFKMPMRISSEKAAAYMYKDLFNNKSTVYFPRRFSFTIRLLSALPDVFKHKICLKMTNNGKV